MTALTLREFRAADIRIPAGVIVSVISSPKNDADLVTRYKDGRIYSVESLSPDDLQIAPGRISPWAYKSELDRSLFAVKGYMGRYRGIFGRTLEIATEHSLDDFTEAAKTITKICGVTT